MIGVGFAGALTGADTFASEAAPTHMLGNIMDGLASTQPIGVLIFLQAGGFLFDRVGYWAPFVLKGAADQAWGLWIVANRKRVEESKSEKALNGKRSVTN